MRFKVGDMAVVNVNSPCASLLHKGDIVKIIAINKWGGYTVKALGEKYSWDLDAYDMDFYTELPVGTQLHLGNVFTDESCDCGGLKTYGSMEP